VTADNKKQNFMNGYRARPQHRRERRDKNKHELTDKRHAHRYQVPCSRAPEPSSAAHAHAPAADGTKDNVVQINNVVQMVI
jgi:hypothetical protein